jgi:GT2 family glycosyltransferase
MPTFDLVLATVDRVEELGRLLDSLERQTHRSFRVLMVDQNDDERAASVVEAHPALEIVRLQAQRGLSRARNTALPHVSADLVAFPDDDCAYPSDLLEHVAQRFASRPELGGLSGRAADPSGRSSFSWAPDGALLVPDNLWNRVISFAVFLRREVVTDVGDFDEQLGLGAATPWSSGEEVDYLIRALRAGALIEYDPDVVVLHEEKTLGAARLRTIGRRDGASIGYILRKHGYPASVLARMFARPLGGVLLSAARGDAARARFHAATLHGRVLGYRSGARAG